MDSNAKRWLILLSGILANLCQGAAYASSVFVVPMMMHLHCTVTNANGQVVPDMKKWALAFSINLAMLPVGMLLSGKIADTKSPRLVVFLGGIVFGLGMFLAGYSNSLAWFYVTFGLMMGLGSGAAYGAVVSTAVRWFPDRRGLASGLSVAALGFGPVLIAPVAEKLMSTGPSPEVAVLFTFKVMGVAFLVIMALASILMVHPPKEFVESVKPASGAAAKAATGVDFKWTQMLGTSKFWLLYVLYACGAFSGLMIISQAKPIAMEINSHGLTPAAMKVFAVSVVMVLAIANASGRFLWAMISDKIGRLLSLTMMFLVTAIIMFAMPKLAADKSTIIPAALILGICFGGYLGTFPALCADAFGTKNMTVNYALLFSGFSVAAIAGPYAAGFIKDASGSYNQAFLVAGVVAFVGLLISLGMTLSQAKTSKIAS